MKTSDRMYEHLKEWREWFMRRNQGEEPTEIETLQESIQFLCELIDEVTS
jgi:hypothetical protein